MPLGYKNSSLAKTQSTQRVCDLNQEEMRQYRGNLTTEGKDSSIKAVAWKKILSYLRKCARESLPMGCFLSFLGVLCVFAR